MKTVSVSQQLAKVFTYSPYLDKTKEITKELNLIRNFMVETKDLSCHFIKVLNFILLVIESPVRSNLYKTTLHLLVFQVLKISEWIIMLINQELLNAFLFILVQEMLTDLSTSLLITKFLKNWSFSQFTLFRNSSYLINDLTLILNFAYILEFLKTLHISFSLIMALKSQLYLKPTFQLFCGLNAERTKLIPLLFLMFQKGCS